MKAIVSDITALWYIRHARCAGLSLAGVPLPPSEEIATGVRDIKRLGLGHLLRDERPCAFLTPARKSRTSSKRLALQEMGALELLAADRPICFMTQHPSCLALRPEACLFMLAHSWPPARLAMLIDELCGGFSLIPSQQAYLQVPPVCTIDGIARMASLSDSAYGVARIRDALAIAGEGAESPLEAQVRTFLCSPLRLGGHGCGHPRCNQVIRPGAPLTAMGADARRAFRLDLYWPDQRFGVECDGAQHKESGQANRDNLRDIRLSFLGIREARISSSGFDSYPYAREFGASVRKSLGRSAKAPRDDAARALWEEIVSSEWEHVPLWQGMGGP